ncbi:MAG: glutathione S-transferase family protein [Proteobacteria bacterium]|nr:glutathione S-transferase family protein [Pseudomonadota bacterium]
MTKSCILYGAPFSLYTGKVRSYLIKQKIPYRELTTATEHFWKEVLPAVHRWRLPTLALPNNEFIQDSTMIVEHFENQPDILSALPDTPKQKITALLFDVIGLEGLLRPAMHYRWNFKDHNDFYLEQSFRTMIAPWRPDPMADARKGMERMRSACDAWGVKPDAFSVIESVYEELLDLLDNHFSVYPYLFGGKPSIGDFGLIAPFYGHLSRDPFPSTMMKKHALRVYRWIERMNHTEADMGEFPDQSVAFIENDDIPDTLKAVLKHMAADLVPESIAAAKCIDQWLDEHQPAPGDPVERGVGFGEFELRGVKIRALAQPYRFLLLARMQQAFADLIPEDQQHVQSYLADLGLDPLLTLRIKRAVNRHDNLEVWG